MKSSILNINKTKQGNRAKKKSHTMIYFLVDVASEARIEQIGGILYF